MTTVPKRLTAARLAGIEELEEAFADTTDTKDIWDGGGTQPQSVGPHVVALQESLLAMGYRLPRFGADGIYGAETTAAVTQFQIDAGHPWPPGHDWEHVGGIAGPNTMAHFDMFDPGGTVANVTGAETGIVARSVTFLESPDNLFAGFDETTSPPSLVLGTRTRRRVRVDVEPGEAGVAYAVADPAVATVGVITGGIVVGGETAGTTMVRALSGDDVLAELVVAVKGPREEIVNFHFVSDSGDPAYGTARTHDKATLLTLRLNRVFRRQANVHFTLGQVRDLVLPLAIGPAFSAAHAAHVQPFATPGELNVFCIWDWQPDGDADPFDPFLMVLPDDDCPDGMTVPHGAGRLLAGDRSLPRRDLMAACNDDADRRRISRELADLFNP